MGTMTSPWPLAAVTAEGRGELGGAHRRAGVDEARMTRELPEARDRGEHPEARLRVGVVAERLDRAAPLGVVEGPLLRRLLDVAHDLGSRRELRRDDAFGPPQQIGADQARERGAPLRIAIAFDRDPELRTETLPGPEQARRDDAEEAPQLAEVVLDRRPGERDTKAGGDLARRRGALRVGVLERVRLVEDEGRERDGGELRFVAVHQLVS